MIDIAVVGSGIAGLTAALYAARSGKKVTVFEKGIPGGQIIIAPSVENYPGMPKVSGADIMSDLLMQIEEAGAELIEDEVTEVRVSGEIKQMIGKQREYECRALIIATGASPAKLGTPKEEDFIGKGVSYCAYCDGAFYKGKTVTVVGGGNTALEDALYLSSLCEKVNIIHRRKEFRGNKVTEKLLAEKSNVCFITESVVTGLIGESKLCGLNVRNLADDSVYEIESDALFVAIGYLPDVNLWKGLVKTDEKGYILADENCNTDREGIFAAGDCRKKKYRQLCTASSDGAIAASEATAYLDRLRSEQKSGHSFALYEL